MKKIKTIFEPFRNKKEVAKNWSWTMPWGPSNSLNGWYREYQDIRFTDNGATMLAKPLADTGSWAMPRLFWTGAPLGYGYYESLMEVPPQNAVVVNVLYTKAHYSYGVRTIMPEIDVAEYGLKTDPKLLNVAVHQWKSPPGFIEHPDYMDPELRHSLDYVNHKQKSSQFAWTGDVIKHGCHVTPKKITIYINDEKVLSVRKCLGHFPDFFTPTFGQLIPKWIQQPSVEPSNIFYFSYEY